MIKIAEIVPQLTPPSPKFETLIGQQRQAFPNAPLIVVALPYREHEIRALLTVLVPYAISRPLQPMSVEDLSVVATLFDKYAMRPAPRYSLARVVEARAAASLDLTSATQCIEWARLAHAVRSVTALKRVLGLTAPSVLREYWLLSDASIAAIPPHIYRALVLVGNTHCLLGDEGLSSINFKYKEGQLYLTTAEGDVVSN